MIERQLITTPIVETWPSNNVPILILGEWCSRYYYKDFSNDFNFKVAPYHWDDRSKLIKDYSYLNKKYETLLDELSTKLNKIHSTKHSKDYWRIFIGPWLSAFIEIIFDRWSMLDFAFDNYNIGSCITIAENSALSKTKDMSDFVNKMTSDDWNEYIYSMLLKNYFSDKLSLSESHINENKKFQEKQSYKNFGQFKGALKRLLQAINNNFPKSAEVFFYKSYLSKKDLFLLCIKLKQFPDLLFKFETQEFEFEPDQNIRGELFDLNFYDQQSFDHVIRFMIETNIPIGYVEGYNFLVASLQKLKLPKIPQIIFTSNAQVEDDNFKLWAAEKKELGSKLVVGQHGGNYGTSPFSDTELHEKLISDHFFTWGWRDEKFPNLVSIGNFCMRQHIVSPKKNGGALLVQMSLPRYSYFLYSVPIASQFLYYLDDQINFVKKLPQNIQNQLIVKLHPKDYGWSLKKRWNETFPNIECIKNSSDIIEMMSDKRINICTYNATTFLQSMSCNFPTLIFWNPVYWELNKDTEPYFELLKDVGIFHETPESAAEQLEKIWDNVPEWWFSNKTQKAKDIFCNYFTKYIDNVPSKLKNIFEKMLNEKI